MIMLRRGAVLRRDLEDGGIHVVAEAGTGTQAIDQALSVRPDVCLIDIRMPDGGGIAAPIRATIVKRAYEANPVTTCAAGLG
jgi:DNA-binding NarL/FixJ family response regulator